MVELLLANGAGVNARNTRRRETALEAATRAGYKEIADLLSAHGAAAR
jgi:ankyrin repeat protein